MWIDQKITVWQRVHFENSNQMKEVIAKFENNEYHSIDDVCDDLYLSAEYLNETEEIISIDENDGQETILIQQNGVDLYSNAPK